MIPGDPASSAQRHPACSGSVGRLKKGACKQTGAVTTRTACNVGGVSLRSSARPSKPVMLEDGSMSEPDQLLAPVRECLSAPRCAVLSSVAADGAPHQALVHYLVKQTGSS